MKVSISKLFYKVAMLTSMITLAGASNSYGLIPRHQAKRAIVHIHIQGSVPQRMPDSNWYQPPENPGFRRYFGS